jgi:hypothetical protein
MERHPRFPELALAGEVMPAGETTTRVVLVVIERETQFKVIEGNTRVAAMRALFETTK